MIAVKGSKAGLLDVAVTYKVPSAKSSSARKRRLGKVELTAMV